MGVCSKGAILLEEWAPLQYSGEAEVMPEAVEEALCKIGGGKGRRCSDTNGVFGIQGLGLGLQGDGCLNVFFMKFHLK